MKYNCSNDQNARVMATETKPWELFDRYVDDAKVLAQCLPQVNEAIPQLSSAKSCVMIGAGYGHHHLPFIRGCMPNVTRLAAVEAEEDSVEELKSRVAKQLPNVSIDYYMEPAENWKGTGERFEVALVFETLQYMSQSDRTALFKRLHDNILANGGLVFLIFSPYSAQNPSGPFSKMVSRLGPPMESADVAEIRDQMVSAGFCSCYELPFEATMGGELNDEFMSMFVMWSEGSLSMEKIREIVEAEFGGKKSIPYPLVLQGFRKK